MSMSNILVSLKYQPHYSHQQLTELNCISFKYTLLNEVNDINYSKKVINSILTIKKK